MLHRHPKTSALVIASIATAMWSCGDINSSWEVKGGGYFKYSINGGSSYTIELAKNDVEPPFYVNNSHHYFYAHTQLSESDRGDQFAIMVNSPSTGKDIAPVARASISGRMEYVTWAKFQNSIESPVIADSSYVHFDEIIGDSLWTADVDLYFVDCRASICKEDIPPIHVTGRLRYWVPEDER